MKKHQLIFFISMVSLMVEETMKAAPNVELLVWPAVLGVAVTSISIRIKEHTEAIYQTAFYGALGHLVVCRLFMAAIGLEPAAHAILPAVLMLSALLGGFLAQKKRPVSL